MEHNGILVIDVYQNWSGPCKATVALFRRLKNELGDDLLGFAVAEADNISALSFYRGKCIPTFLFFAGKKLQAVVRGCNAPALERTIQEQLAKEHKVQSGEIERTEFVDPELEARMRAEEEARLEALKPKPVPKTCSVLVIKPDAVEAGHVDEILEKLRENGMEIVKSEEKQLSEEETREMYKENEEEPWFEELIELMTRGPCHIVIVTKGATGEEVIPELRKLIGPTDAEQAKEEEPESLRALYGTNKLVNGVHAADSKEQAAQELAFFFPNADLPMQEQIEPGEIQRTLAIIRPDAYRERGEEILSQIKASGFTVALQKELTLTREQAMAFYAEHKDEPFFEMLVDNMTSGPVLALGLAREDAISRWREMLGPKEKERAVEDAPQSLRAQFSVESAPVNQIHGSDSKEAAEKELEFFFPKQQTLAVIKPNAMDKKEEIMAKISEAGFEVSAQKQSQLTKEMAENFYGEHADKEFFPQLVEFMSSGETLFMVLTREDAVDGFRKLAGNKDPEVAKTEDPDSIRALFGDDILKNGIHSSSTIEQALEKIPKVFEDQQKAKDTESAMEQEGVIEDAAAPGEATDGTEAEEGDEKDGPVDDQEKTEDETEKELAEEATEQEATGEQEEADQETEQPSEQTGEQTEQEVEQSPQEETTEGVEAEQTTEQKEDEEEQKPEESGETEQTTEEQAPESEETPTEQEQAEETAPAEVAPDAAEDKPEESQEAATEEEQMPGDSEEAKADDTPAGETDEQKPDDEPTTSSNKEDTTEQTAAA